MAELSGDELTRLAAARALPLDGARIRVILPEVRRILEAAARLRELPIDPAASPREAS